MKQMNNIIKRILMLLGINGISLIIAMIMNLILPRYISVSEYGYWQLYLMYVTYLAYNSFGWIEGIYLHYGGLDYKSLNKEEFTAQFKLFFLYEVLISVLTGIVLVIISGGMNRALIALCEIATIIGMVKLMLQNLLQAIGNIKEYSKTILIDRVFLIGGVIIFLMLGWHSFYAIICADILSKLSGLILSLFYCKKMLIKNVRINRNNLLNIKDLIASGSMIMLANLTGILITGIARMAIEKKWGISTFGQISFTINVSNMFITCISAVSVVLFPIMKNMEINYLKSIYVKGRNLLVILALGALCFYTPVAKLLFVWLPQYKESLKYMAVLFPIFVFESKTIVMVNTYLKVMEKTKKIFLANFIVLLFSIAATYIAVFKIEGIQLATVTILIGVFLKGALSELFLGRYLQIRLTKNIVEELLLVILFVILNMWFGGWKALFGYIIGYSIFVYRKRKYLNFKQYFKNSY